MGSTLPKWRIKQKRQKINDARRAALVAKKTLVGIKRIAHH